LNKDHGGCDKSILDNLKVAAPCPASWDEMVGTDRERFCSNCALNVFNISTMTRKEAEEFLALKAEGRVCVQFFRRHDGTILTDNCPKGLRRLRDQGRRLLKAASAFLALLFTGQAAIGDNSAPPVDASKRLMGEPTIMVKGRAAAPVSSPADAEATYQTKLNCQLKANKPNAADIARARADLAYFYRDKQDYKKSISQFQQAAEALRHIKGGAKGEERNLLANILMNWAATEKLNKQEKKAAQLEAEAVALQK
jgi:hypothetical protein